MKPNTHQTCLLLRYIVVLLRYFDQTTILRQDMRNYDIQNPKTTIFCCRKRDVFDRQRDATRHSGWPYSRFITSGDKPRYRTVPRWCMAVLYSCATEIAEGTYLILSSRGGSIIGVTKDRDADAYCISQTEQGKSRALYSRLTISP